MGEVERDQEGAGRYIGERTGKPVVCEPQVREQPQPANCRRYAAVSKVFFFCTTQRQGKRASRMRQYLYFGTSKAGTMST